MRAAKHALKRLSFLFGIQIPFHIKIYHENQKIDSFLQHNQINPLPKVNQSITTKAIWQ